MVIEDTLGVIEDTVGLSWILWVHHVHGSIMAHHGHYGGSWTLWVPVHHGRYGPIVDTMDPS